MSAQNRSTGGTLGNHSRAYTLLESVAVLAVIGALAGALAPALRAPQREVKTVAPDSQSDSSNVAGVTTRACCFAASCQNRTPSECAADGGITGPAGSVCGQFNCNTPGACCVPGGCFVGPPSQCLPSGNFRGYGTNCNIPNICNPNEACCRGPECAYILPNSCRAGGGEPQGPGSTCENTNCALRPQGCCRTDGSCVVVDPRACIANQGRPLGPDRVCEGDENNDNIDDACQTDQPCEDCGPGPHWVDQCAEGLDDMPTGALVGIDTSGDCIADVNMVLHGPAVVRRSKPMDDSNNFPGIAPDDGHLEVLDTEMVSMHLTGGGAVLRAGLGQSVGAPIQRTLGAIVEDPGLPPQADSFFDVFFELDLGGGQRAYNRTPLRVRSKITCVPPDADYLHPGGCTPLYTSPFPGAGTQVGNLVSANHEPYIECGSGATGDCREPHDTPFCRNKECCQRVCELATSCCTQAWNPNCVALAQQVCQPSGACCRPQVCENAGTCDSGFSNCHNHPDCLCFQTAEDGSSCTTSHLCGDLVVCPNGTVDCPVGQVCYVNTCCGEPVCAPEDCPTAAAAAALTAEPAEQTEGRLTMSGGKVDSTAGAGGGCFETHETACQEIGGNFQGAGTTCLNTECGPPVEGCCLPNGACINVVPDYCRQLQGVPHGADSRCQGDSNGNDIDDLCEVDDPCEDCGPGPHWVDSCPGGMDVMPTGVVAGIDTDLDCVADLNIILDGPANVARANSSDDSTNYPGLRLTDLHLDVIDTEMVSMTLTGGGVTLIAGGGYGQGGVLRRSQGAIAEQPGDASQSDSFFDVFAEITLDGGSSFLYNQDPLKVSTIISCLPPQGVYVHHTECLPLYDSAQGGTQVANLVSARHGTYPTCGSEVTGPCNEPHDTPFCNHGDCCAAVCEQLPQCCEQSWDKGCVSYAQKVCEPFGACCAGGACQRADTCAGGFDTCGGDLGCYCFELAGDGGLCTRNFFCDRVQCPNGHSDCPAGQRCFVNTCCGAPVCTVPGCPAPGGTSAAEEGDPSAGMAFNRPDNVSGIFPGTGPCQNMTRLSCENIGGFFRGGGTTCETVECADEQACCLPDGSCRTAIPSQCHQAGGVPGGVGSNCRGDSDGDGIDDACFTRSCEECGPGAHWIHNPPCPPGGSGQDTLPSGAVAGIDVNNDCVADFNFILGGPVTIAKVGPRDDSGVYTGLRPIDGHLDVIDTEILAMSLTGGGITLKAGEGLGMIPLRRTSGAIAEQLGNPALADSFFDVFFEITDGGGFQVYNRTPVRVETTITCLPPDGIYAHITGCTPLYSSPHPNQGTFVANLVSANHFTYPGCCFGEVCRQLPVTVCEAQGGTVVPDCLGDSDNNKVDDACEKQACCLPNGKCVETIPARCREANGVPQGLGSECAGDSDGDGIDDRCPARPCEECGPGLHWIHNPPCPPGGHGQDTVPSGAYAGIDFTGDCIADFNMILSGPATIRKRGPVDASHFVPGHPVDGHLDVVQTQLIAMELTGSGATLRLNPRRPSRGEVVEQLGNPALADSFFDVFFEVDLGGTRLYNTDAVRVATVVPCLPPDGIYTHIGGCTPLSTSPDPNEGEIVAFLTSANHFTYPGCCLPNGQCIETSGPACEERGGTVVPKCLGDNNGNQVDDACERKCEPTPDGSACAPVDCPSRVDRCAPRCVKFNPSTGRVGVTECECTNIEKCHMELAPSSDGVVAGGGGGCVVPDNGSGTVTLPPAGCEYLSPADVHQIIDGLPPGTTIELGAIHREFICHQGGAGGVCSFIPDVDCSEQGGSLGGEKECVDSFLALDMHGTNTLNGFDRMMNVPISFETHTAPRAPGDPVQSFDTDMFRLFGQITNPSAGDPDFDLLRIVAGTDFGLPSPGHTVLTRLGGNWAVDSFFDITYRIDFVGKPGGKLSGMSGSTTGTIRMQTAPPFKCRGGCDENQICRPRRSPNADGTWDVCCVCTRRVVEVDHFESSRAKMVLQYPDGASESIDLSGPTMVHVFFEGDDEGDAVDDDGDGLDDAGAQLVHMKMTGVSPRLGSLEVRLHPGKPSQGEIEEKANTVPGRLDLPPFAPAGAALSFFDVFFEIQAGNLLFHTQQPKRMESQIRHKPPAPGDTYENPDKIPLLDANGNPTGISLGASSHTPNPGAEQACCLPQGVCRLATPEQCRDAGGVPQGPNTQCENIECVQPTVLRWESVVTHGQGVGPVAIPLAPDGSSSEPRSAVRKVVIVFDGPIDPASAILDNVNICGLKPGPTLGTFVPVDLSGVIITVKTSSPFTRLEINFAPGLPDYARYLISLKGIYGPGGPLKPGNGGLSRQFTALQGDANADRRVNATDVGGCRSLVPRNPINPTSTQEVRCDANNDGRINATDIGGIRSKVPNDARSIPKPECP